MIQLVLKLGFDDAGANFISMDSIFPQVSSVSSEPSADIILIDKIIDIIIKRSFKFACNTSYIQDLKISIFIHINQRKHKEAWKKFLI